MFALGICSRQIRSMQTYGNLEEKAKASAASRSILQDFLDSVKALAWLELECDI